MLLIKSLMKKINPNIKALFKCTKCIHKPLRTLRMFIHFLSFLFILRNNSSYMTELLPEIYFKTLTNLISSKRWHFTETESSTSLEVTGKSFGDLQVQYLRKKVRVSNFLVPFLFKFPCVTNSNEIQGENAVCFFL